MVVVLIHHSSRLAANLIALALYYKFRHLRTLRLIVVENRQLTNDELKPWCGINTVHNPRLENQHFLVDHLIRQTLVSDPNTSVIPLKAITVSPIACSNISMDVPIRAQKEEIKVMVGLESMVGLIYNPLILVDRMKQVLLSSGIVSYTSLLGSQNLDQLLQQVQRENQILVMDYCTNTPRTNFRNFHYLMNSNLAPLRSDLHNSNVPRAILWLPKFKSAASIPPHNPLHYRVRKLPKGARVDIAPEKYDIIESEVVMHLDLYQCLKACDVALHIMEEMTGSVIDTMTYRL